MKTVGEAYIRKEKAKSKQVSLQKIKEEELKDGPEEPGERKEEKELVLL